jgi:hypothetical protein
MTFNAREVGADYLLSSQWQPSSLTLGDDWKTRFQDKKLASSL